MTTPYLPLDIWRLIQLKLEDEIADDRHDIVTDTNKIKKKSTVPVKIKKRMQKNTEDNMKCHQLRRWIREAETDPSIHWC